MENVKFEFKSLGDGTCELSKIILNEDVETLCLPARSPEGEAVIGRGKELIFSGKGSVDRIRSVHIPASFERVDKWSYYGLPNMQEWVVAPGNKSFASVEGLLYSADRRALIACPRSKSGTIRVAAGTSEICENAFSGCSHVKKVFLPESIRSIDREAFCMTSIIVYIPDVDVRIHENAFASEYVYPSICAPRGSAAHRFAIAQKRRFTPWEKHPVWDHERWKSDFAAASTEKKRRALRRQVWQDTLNVAKNAGYNLSDDQTVVLELEKIAEFDPRFYSRLYPEAFHAAYFPLKEPAEIRAVPDDCLEVARAWTEEGLEVCVLDMADDRGFGECVENGTETQEECLFRRSDYFRHLYRHAPDAEQHKVERDAHSYLLSRDFGGIYSPAVVVFRGDEASGYAYLEKPFRVNVVAVAGVHLPEPASYAGNGAARTASRPEESVKDKLRSFFRVDRKEEPQIAPLPAESVKNKIRTVLRIAQDNGQRNLILGALGCGALQNPSKQVAELFGEVLCEDEFAGAFRRIVFAVKTDHNSQGSANYDAFKGVLDGLALPIAPREARERRTNIRKIAVSRDGAALLRDDGSVRYIDFRTGCESVPENLHHLSDIAAGFSAVFGLRHDGELCVWNAERSDEYAAHLRTIRGKHPGGKIAAAEGHVALLDSDGRVVSAEGGGFEFESYAREINGWRDMEEIALSFQMALGLRRDGSVVATRVPWEGGKQPHPLADIGEMGALKLPLPVGLRRPVSPERKPVMVATGGSYYGYVTVAILRRDGTVAAYNNDTPIAVAEEWKGIVKIACCDGAVFALDERGELRSWDLRDDTHMLARNVRDIACGLCDAVAMEVSGRLRHFDRHGEEK